MPRRNEKRKKTVVPGIWQTADDKFVVRARWTDPRTGMERKREGTASTLSEAVAMKEEMRGRTPTAKPTRQRFGDYAEHYLAVHGGRLAPSTAERYAGELAHWVVEIGSFYVDAIAASDVREALLEMAKRAAPSTANGRLRTLRQVLDDAVGDRLVAFNPARKVKTLPERRTRGRRGNALSVEEFSIFLVTVDVMIKEKAIAEDIGRLLLVIAWTGMRRGEALALRWTDRNDDELHVERSIWRDHEKTVKTDDPRRVTITEPLARALDDQRRWLVARQHEGLASGLMFPSSPKQRAQAAVRFPDREPTWFRSGSCLDKPLRDIVERAGVTPVSPHSFRRTMENLARRAGVDGLVRRAQAGWRTESAQAIYATVDASERKAAGDAVVSFVSKAKKAEDVRPARTPDAAHEAGS